MTFKIANLVLKNTVCVRRAYKKAAGKQSQGFGNDFNIILKIAVFIYVAFNLTNRFF